MAKEKTSYTALMVDIVSSRMIPAGLRIDVQKRLIALIDTLNKLFASGIEQKLTLSGGDEVQGLFTESGDAFTAGRLLQIGLYPVLVRVGIGKGGWTIRTPGEPSTFQDGTAYHYAREAMADLRGRQDATGPQFTEENERRMDVSNTLARTVFAWTREQTEAQREVSMIYEVDNLFAHSQLAATDASAINAFLREARLWRRRFLSRRPLFDEAMQYVQALPPNLRKASLAKTAFDKQELYAVEKAWPHVPHFSLASIADIIGGDSPITEQAISQRRVAGHVDLVIDLDEAWVKLQEITVEEDSCSCS